MFLQTNVIINTGTAVFEPFDFGLEVGYTFKRMRPHFDRFVFIPECLNVKTTKTFQATRQRPAFTLFEVLVAMAVLAVLTAILLPTIHTARERAKRISCLANERQILMAMMSYSADFDGYLPTEAKTTFPYTDWSSRLPRA